MKKYLSIICAAAMICSLGGCGSKSSDSSSSSTTTKAETTIETITEATTEKATEAATQKQTTTEAATESTTEAKKNDSFLDPKDIEVNKTPAMVTIFIPADIIDDQQKTVEKARENPLFDTVEPNADGSVTYTMSRENHKEFMQELSESFDESIQGLVDKCSTISSIDHNSDYTSFDVNVTDVKQYQDSFDPLAVVAITITGSYYGHFNGKNISKDDISINIIGPDGTIVQQ